MSSKFEAKNIRANHRIRAPQIRLIGAAGEQIGIVSAKEGLRLAQEAGLDLVEVSPNAEPPVCRILDLGKYLYTLEKKEKESRKKQKVTMVKEIKLSSKIQEHDFQTKLRNARRFIQRGDKVKLTMFFRGREITHMDVGQRVIERFIQEIADMAELEKNEGLTGRALHLYLTPISSTKKTLPKREETGEKNAETKDKQGGQEAV